MVDPNSRTWIETVSGFTYAGKKPQDLGKEYFEQRQQIDYFNGNLEQLYQSVDTVDWLKNNVVEKILFLEEQLWDVRKDKPPMLEALKDKFPAAKQQFTARKLLREFRIEMANFLLGKKENKEKLLALLKLKN